MVYLSKRSFAFLLLCAGSLIVPPQPASAGPTLPGLKTCWDYNLTYQFGFDDDPFVNVVDVNLFVSYVDAHRGTIFAIGHTSPWFTPLLDFDDNNVINVADLNAMLIFIHSQKPGPIYAINCDTCGC